MFSSISRTSNPVIGSESIIRSHAHALLHILSGSGGGCTSEANSARSSKIWTHRTSPRKQDCQCSVSIRRVHVASPLVSTKVRADVAEVHTPPLGRLARMLYITRAPNGPQKQSCTQFCICTYHPQPASQQLRSSLMKLCPVQ